MTADHPSETPKRIAFLSSRISGTDGVSLEIAKWARVLESMGHVCFYIAGLCDDRPADRSHVIPEAHFQHPVIAEINRQCFGYEKRNPEVTEKIKEMTWVIKEKLREALTRFEADLLIAENCVTIPMNIPLGIAVVETVMETPISCIAHHHDFVWERQRFRVSAVDDYLEAAFPPPLRHIQHIAINSQAAAEFSRRTGLPCRVIPNVMDFDAPPPAPDEYSRGFRADLGLAEGDILVLQPTRLVQRKNIETSIELVRRLEDPRFKLVITHSSGDEGDAYTQRVRSYARLLGVEVIFAEHWVAHERGTGPDGHRIYTVDDVYQQADIVTYPSTYEGFGNAFLEAVYFRKPILCNRYSIYQTDIEPCGFRTILMDGFLTDEVVEDVRRVVSDAGYREDMISHNFEVGRRFFSHARVETELHALLAKPRIAVSCSP